MNFFVQKVLIIIFVFYLLESHFVFANFNHGRNCINCSKTRSVSEKVEDEKNKLYLKARTFFINEDLDQAKAIINKQLELYPSDKQAILLKNMIERSLMRSVNFVHKNTRADLLLDVENAWSIPVEGPNKPEFTNSSTLINTMQNKLSRIIIPRVCFINLPISKVIETISELSIQYDTLTSNGDAKGINIVLVGSNESNEPKINLNLRNISLERLLFYVGQAANYRCDYTNDAVVIGDAKLIQEQLETRFFAISRATIIKLTGLQGLNHKSLAQDQISILDEEAAIKNFFIRAGVEFSTVNGSNLAFDGSQLIVTHNLKNLQRIERILQKYSEAKQVEIEAKFLEVTQGALDELAFRWNVMNKFDPTRGQISTGIKNGNMSTDNLRTMSQAFASSSSSTGDGKVIIDKVETILNNQPPKLAGQINIGVSSVPLGSFLGVVDRAQIGLMIRALEQNNGSDLMSAPKLTVLSGKTANIVVAQELRYPQNYGETHSEVGSGSSLTTSTSAGVTITAGTPRDFITRNVGVEMKVTPTVEDNDNISLQLEPKVTEFEGFMEYGGMSVAVASGTTVYVPSGFYQPVFSTREIQTEVTVQNGATVIMGGLTREEVKEVSDKIPLLGDIPLLGKLFRSKSETSQKRNLLIFVTARTVSTNGARYTTQGQKTNFSKILTQESVK